VDVGKLDDVKDFLEDTFDHTLLLNVDDPCRNKILGFCGTDLASIRAVPNCGMEGLAKLVLTKVEDLLDTEDNRDRGLRVIMVTCWEDSKNSATFQLTSP
jgi:6-pyruvoyltetrahydropterin/6-carboxytetrahydropterin synthase